MKQPTVYMLASGWRGTLYVGVTSDLVKRVWGTQDARGRRFHQELLRARPGLVRATFVDGIGDIAGEIHQGLEAWMENRIDREIQSGLARSLRIDFVEQKAGFQLSLE